MKRHAALFLVHLGITSAAFAHPGGGIVALSEHSVIFADPVENHLWRLERDQPAQRVVSRFHGHWLTRGLDGKLYAEAFQESGGAWSSSAFRLDLADARLTEVAHRDEVGALVFAVDRDGALVFQRGAILVARREGRESPFRPHADQPALGSVTAYAWGAGGELFYADRGRIRRVDHNGATTLVAEIGGKVLEPWSIFGLAIDAGRSVLAAVPDLGKVYRIGNDRVPVELPPAGDGWRATGVATFSDSVFLLESDPRASTSARVRVLRPDGEPEVWTVPRPAQPGP